MNNTGFAITSEDVQFVLNNNERAFSCSGGDSIETVADMLLTHLDAAMIEKSALYGDTLDEQMYYAQEEIARQLLDVWGYII